MPQFRYRAITPAGEVVEGLLDAADRGAALEHLEEQGHLPVRAEETATASVLTRDLFAKPGLTTHALGLISRELATFLHAGLPLDRALEMMEQMAAGKSERDCLRRLLERIAGGSTLGDAMAAEDRAFPPFYVSIVRAGEAGGSIEAALYRLADQLDAMRRTREHVRSALIYPMIVLATCGVSIAVLLLFVVPRFRPLFEQAGTAVPFATQVVLALSEGLQEFGWLALIVVPTLVLLVRRQLRQPAWRAARDRALMRLPLIGDLVTKLEVARFTRTLGTLLRNGVTLVSAFAITRETVDNRVIAAAIAPVADSISGGKGLAEPLMKTGVFPPLAINLIRVGEETARHDEMMLKIAELYDEEARRSIDRILALIGPVVTVVLGIAVAGIIGSILTALLSVYDLAI